ncbi:MAG: protein rep, partial [Fusobacteriaceae bacterium]
MKNNTIKKVQNQEKNEIIEKFGVKKSKVDLFYEFVRSFKSESMNERISTCAGIIGFLKSEDGEKRRLGGGNFCNSRFCPVCDWRKARKEGYIIKFLIQYLKQEKQQDFLFLTLTAPNVTSEHLDFEIKDFNKSFEKLARSKRFKDSCNGYIRKLEVTYNVDKDTYHPHFHVLLSVNPSYFKKKKYISQAEWLEMWRKAKDDDSITQVDIRKAKMDDMKSVMELATYSAKSNDILYSKSVF